MAKVTIFSVQCQEMFENMPQGQLPHVAIERPSEDENNLHLSFSKRRTRQSRFICSWWTGQRYGYFWKIPTFTEYRYEIATQTKPSARPRETERMEIKDNNHEVKSDNEVSAVLRKYDNFDEQQFYNRYADEIEADLNRREQQSNNNNGTEENDSTREEQRHDRGNQVQSGQRTDDNSGSEGGKYSEGKVRTRDEGSDEQKSSSEESAVWGLREQETDIEHGEGSNGVDNSSHKTDNQGNPLNADGTLKLEQVESVDELTDEEVVAITDAMKANAVIVPTVGIFSK